MISGYQLSFPPLTHLLPNAHIFSFLIAARTHGSIPAGHFLRGTGNPNVPTSSIPCTRASLSLHNQAKPQNSHSDQQLLLTV